jgi:hypothetical protein
MSTTFSTAVVTVFVHQKQESRRYDNCHLSISVNSTATIKACHDSSEKFNFTIALEKLNKRPGCAVWDLYISNEEMMPN